MVNKAGDAGGQAAYGALPPIDVKQMAHVLRRLTGYALRYRVRSALAVASALAAAVFNLITPRLLGRAVDQADTLLTAGAGGKARLALYATAELLIVISVLRGLSTGYQAYLGEWLAQRVGYDLRLAFFEKLQRLSFAFHDAVHSGELITRGMLDVEGVRGFLESGALRAVTVILLVVVGSFRLLTADFITGLCALSFVPFVVWRAGTMGYLLRFSWNRLQELNSVITRKMEENLQGVRVVRAFASHQYELDQFDRSAEAALVLSANRIGQRFSGVRAMNIAYFTAMGLVLLVGGHRVAAHAISVGTLTEMLTFMTILQQPLRQVGMIVNSSARASSAGARLAEILDFEPEIADAPDAVALPDGPAALKFDHVSFRYPTAAPGRMALSDISFSVAPGQVLGIVGPPGSGKSTIAQLVPRFYDVTQGRITVGGHDVGHLTLPSLRRAVGLVQQDVFLFDTSVHENIAYTDPSIDEEEVSFAAQIAQIHDHVDQLPDRYQTRVGERGVGLSGGQRQRISIARGLVAKPEIIILDDSTAAIDAATEVQIRAALDHTLTDKAVIIIAHRLNSLANADEIIVLDQGRIVERGSHAQLLAQNGAYAALWRLQNKADR